MTANSDFVEAMLAQAEQSNKLARGTELVCNVGERCACVLSDAGNSCQAHNDNERQHNRVFNRGWSVFALQKTL